MLWVTLGGLFFFWRIGSLCRRVALVLVILFEITGILSASVYNIERCAVGPRPQGLLERPGEDFVFAFVWGALRRRGIVEEEARQVMYKPMKYGNPPPKRPPHDSATTTQLRVESFTAFDSHRRITHLAHSNFSRRCCGCRIFDASSFCGSKRVFLHPRPHAFAPATSGICTQQREFLHPLRCYKRPAEASHLR
jgi:hypothetical protein